MCVRTYVKICEAQSNPEFFSSVLAGRTDNGRPSRGDGNQGAQRSPQLCSLFENSRCRGERLTERALPSGAQCQPATRCAAATGGVRGPPRVSGRSSAPPSGGVATGWSRAEAPSLKQPLPSEFSAPVIKLFVEEELPPGKARVAEACSVGGDTCPHLRRPQRVKVASVSVAPTVGSRFSVSPPSRLPIPRCALPLWFGFRAHP